MDDARHEDGGHPEDDRRDRIRRRAYALWEREGRPEGRAAEHWARAEWEIDAEAPAPPRPEPAAGPPTGAPELNLSATAEGMRDATGGPVSPDGGARGRVAKARRKDATSG